MDLRDIPPPYSDVPKQPHHPEGQSMGYASPSSPTFEPPYMSAPPHQQPYMSAPPPPQPSSTHVTVVSGVNGVVPGSCPVCGNRSWTGTYSCMAWLLCFFCFWNCGLCCCLCMRRKKCTKCGFSSG